MSVFRAPKILLFSSVTTGFFIVFTIMSCASIVENSASENTTVKEGLTQSQAKLLVNPVAYTRESVKKGRLSFIQYCASCHDSDGKARSAIMANAADLTAPASWLYGSSDGEIFRTVRDGAGRIMPPFRYLINTDKDIWNIVNFIHSLRSDARQVESENRTKKVFQRVSGHEEK